MTSGRSVTSCGRCSRRMLEREHTQVFPDRIEPYLGWRVWGVINLSDGKHLHSLNGTEPWPFRREFIASCKLEHGSGTAVVEDELLSMIYTPDPNHHVPV